MTLSRILLATALALPMATRQAAGTAAAQGIIRIAITDADIPLTHRQPDQGFEGTLSADMPPFSPRAMSPTVKVFVPPQSWFVDLRLPYIQ